MPRGMFSSSCEAALTLRCTNWGQNGVSGSYSGFFLFIAVAERGVDFPESCVAVTESSRGSLWICSGEQKTG